MASRKNPVEYQRRDHALGVAARVTCKTPSFNAIRGTEARDHQPGRSDRIAENGKPVNGTEA